ncbi:MAG: Neutral ceramidase, partial [Planctomycetaceae bacterium]|nr:Neutral ceramidase [Planctomycetaceae bacterium]
MRRIDRFPYRCCHFALIVVLCHFSTQQIARAGWKAGVATAKITPEKSMWMAGFAARKKPSEGVAQDLYAKALAIQDEQGQRLVIVTTDLIGIPRDLRLKLAQQAQEKHKLPREGLWLNASHTHCGPELRMKRVSLDGPAEDVEQRLKVSLDYMARLEQQLIEIIGVALDKLEPANLDYLHARCGFAMNRRRPTVTGVTNSPHSDGPVN